MREFATLPQDDRADALVVAALGYSCATT
jgi:hypothetical protein